MGFKVRITARGEGVEYRDENGVYRFYASGGWRQWKIYFPCTKGDDYHLHEMNEEERATVLSNIRNWFQSKRVFGFFGPRYTVSFVTDGPICEQRARRLAISAKYFEHVGKG